MKSLDYTIQHLYAGKRPTCLICDNETKYLGLEFKKYCHDHGKFAMKEAGKIGGKKKKNWNLGQTKETHPILAKFSIDYTGEGNPFFGKRHPKETQNQINDKNRLLFSEVVRRIRLCVPTITVLTTSELYRDRQETLLDIQCNDCKNFDKVSLFNLERCWRCHVCHPIGSRPQIDLYNWIKNDLGFLDATSSDRSVITPLEIDVYVPSCNVAIEYNGLHWHSGDKEDVFNKTRHKEKYLACKEKGIRLLQFYSDEFETSPEICRSMIKNALGVIDVKLNARDCEVIELTTREAKEFLEVSHIAGYTRSTLKFGLKHPEYGVVSVATMRTPIQKKWGNVAELARMASKPGFIVRGGASKLLKVIFSRASEKGFDGLLSYAELRYGSGGVYEQCGFDLVGMTGPNYWYTEGLVRHDRFKYRAQNGMTEKEYTESQGVRSVWGVGNNVYLKRFSQKNDTY